MSAFVLSHNKWSVTLNEAKYLRLRLSAWSQASETKAQSLAWRLNSRQILASMPV